MPDIEFLNVCVQADTVLRRFGAWFSPILGKRPTLGQKGLGTDAPPNWRELLLDSEAAQVWGRKWAGTSGATTPRASSITPGATATRATGRCSGHSSPARWMMTTGRR